MQCYSLCSFTIIVSPRALFNVNHFKPVYHSILCTYIVFVLYYVL